MLLAWFLSGEDPTVKVGFFTLITGLGTAFIVGFFQMKTTKREVREAKAAIGTPNGKGDVVQMNEKQLTRLGVIEDKLDFMTDLLLKHISTPGAHGGHSGYSPMDEYTSGR